MKRRMFLKGLASLPLGFGVFKSIDTEQIKPKEKIVGEDVVIINEISGDGGYWMSKESSDAIIKTIYENHAQIKRVLR